MYVKKAPAARETSVLQSAIRNHCIAQDEVQALTMPAPRVSAAIQRQVGVKSTNQNSQQLHQNTGEAAHLFDLIRFRFPFPFLYESV